MREAVTLFLYERTYLIQLLKGLIDKVLPKNRPKFFADSYLEKEFIQYDKKRDYTP